MIDTVIGSTIAKRLRASLLNMTQLKPTRVPRFFLLTFHAKALQVLVQGRDKRIVRSQVNFIPGALDNSKPIFLQAEVRVRESALSGRIYSRLSLLVHFVFSSMMMREGK